MAKMNRPSGAKDQEQLSLHNAIVRTKMPQDIEQRRRTYATVSNALAHLDNTQLAALLPSSDQKHGWGGTHVIKVAGTKVFVKKIPLTALEFEQPFNTANLYNMPTFYNYGVGSAGFGAYRELVAHIKTTNWALSGACANFPLMYHHRIVPFVGEHQSMEDDRRRGYVDYWGGDVNIDRYMVERGRASHQIVLCLEYFPHVAHEWLLKNPRRIEHFIRQLYDTALFMRREGMIHFDIHMANVVSDGYFPYVADFGLVNDRSFHLSNAEREFFDLNIDYDPAYVVSAIGTSIYNFYRNAPEPSKARLAERFGITDDYRLAVTELVKNVEIIRADGLLDLDNYYASYVAKNRELILIMHDFLCDLRGNPKKDTHFPYLRIDELVHGQ